MRVLTKVAGDQTAIIQLLENGDELRLTTFSVLVKDDEPIDRQPLMPEPDFNHR